MPRLPRLDPAPVVSRQRVDPRDIGRGAGDLAMARSVDELAIASHQIFEAEQVARVSRGVSDSSGELEKWIAEDEEKNLDGHTDRLKRFDAAGREIIQRFRGDLSGHYTREYDDRMREFMSRARLRVADGVRRRRVDIAAGDAVMAFDEFARREQEADSDSLREFYRKEQKRVADAAVASGAWSPEHAASIRTRADDRARDAARVRDSAAIADEIAGSTQDHAERLKKARSIKDVEVRDRVAARLKDINSEERAAREERERVQRDTLVRDAYDGKLKHEDLVGLPIEASLRSSLEAILDAKDKTGPEDKAAAELADKVLFYKLREMATNPATRWEFKRLDLSGFAGTLNQGHFDSLVQLQQAEDKTVLRSYPRKVEDAIKANIYKGGAGTAAQQNTAIAFRDAVEAEKVASEHRLGRELADDEIDAVISAQLQTYWKDRWWSLSGERRFEIQVPDEVAAEIRAEKRQQLGIELTDREIRDIYFNRQRAAGELATEGED